MALNVIDTQTGDENKKWREEQKRKRQSGGGGGGGGTGGSNGGRKASKEDEAVEAESKRLRAVREAERQVCLTLVFRQFLLQVTWFP